MIVFYCSRIVRFNSLYSERVHNTLNEKFLFIVHTERLKNVHTERFLVTRLETNDMFCGVFNDKGLDVWKSFLIQGVECATRSTSET